MNAKSKALSWQNNNCISIYIFPISVTQFWICIKFKIWNRWFSPGTPVSSTNKTDRHDIAELFLKVALNTINHKAQIENVEAAGWSMIRILRPGTPTMELYPHFNFLFTYLFLIKMFLLFPLLLLFSLLFVSIDPYSLMVTTACLCRSYTLIIHHVHGISKLLLQ